MSATSIVRYTTVACLLTAASAFAAPPSLMLIGMGPGDISADGNTVVGGVYDSGINESIVYKFTRGVGAFRTGYVWDDGEIRCSADASAVSWGAYNDGDVGGFGTNRTIAHRWTLPTGSVNIGMLPNGNRCDFNINTPYDISGNGRYVVGGGWTESLCGPFRAWRYDSQTSGWEQLPVSISAPPLNLPANATRANSVSTDGSVVGGYDQNYNPQLTQRSRHAAVWVKSGSTWTQTVLDWYGGEVYAVSADGNVVVGKMSSTTMQATFGTSVTTPVRWVRSGSNWIPFNMGGGDGSALPVALSADGSTVVGMGIGAGGWIWRANLNEGNAMDLDTYVASLGGSFPGWAFGTFVGSPIRGISADGNAILTFGEDGRGPCLTTFAACVLYLNGSSCEPAQINFGPVSQYVPGGPTSFGIILNCFAAGTWTMNYQWQKETGPGTDVWVNLTDDNCSEFSAANFNFRGTAGTQLRLGALDGVWQGRYRCVVTNDCGTATSSVAHITVCAADFNDDGFVSGDDFDQYVALFELGAPDADFNGDGFVSGDDFDAFVVAFEAGC